MHGFLGLFGWSGVIYFLAGVVVLASMESSSIFFSLIFACRPTACRMLLGCWMVRGWSVSTSARCG